MPETPSLNKSTAPMQRGAQLFCSFSPMYKTEEILQQEYNLLLMFGELNKYFILTFIFFNREGARTGRDSLRPGALAVKFLSP
jgi:hypothetical protein